MSGSNSGEVTPVPMPNTEVKLSSADGSWGFAPARVGRRQAIKPGCDLFRILVFLICIKDYTPLIQLFI